jgi:hypothetical protein
MSEGRIIERTSDDYTFRYYESAAGIGYTHFECERRLVAAKNAMERWFSRALRTRTTSGDAEQDQYELQQLRWVADEITEYAEVIQRELDRLEGVDRKAERVKALRSVEGRTPEEAAAFLAKAAQLESEAWQVRHAEGGRRARQEHGSGRGGRLR